MTVTCQSKSWSPCSVVQSTIGWWSWNALPPQSASLLAMLIFTDLDYADDIALLAHATDDLHTALEVFETTASQLGLHVSWQKTKIQNPGCRRTNIQPISQRSVCGGSSWIYISLLCSIYHRQVSTRYSQTDWHCLHCHAIYEQSLASGDSLGFNCRRNSAYTRPTQLYCPSCCRPTVRKHGHFCRKT